MDRINWNEMWKERTSREGKRSESSFWDSFSEHFRKKTGEDKYAELCYEYAQLKPGETVFDMGCGAGTLAIPFAKKGHEVYAADFSQGMLDSMMKQAEEEGAAGEIHPVKLDWEEDWSERDLPQCDIVIASRSLFFRDLASALKKLETVALKRVCLVSWDTPAPGYDRYVAAAVSYKRPGYGLHYLIMGELMDRDVYPELIYVRTPFRNAKYFSRQEAVETLKSSFTEGLTEEQTEKLEAYCSEHLKHFEHMPSGEKSARGDAQGETEYWQLDHDDMSSLAFIRWNINDVYDNEQVNGRNRYNGD